MNRTNFNIGGTYQFVGNWYTPHFQKAKGSNKALNATGRLASNWEFDTLSIWKGNPLHVVISKYSF